MPFITGPKRLLLLFLVALLLVLGNAFVLFGDFRKLIDAQTPVIHTLEIRNALDRLISGLSAAESAQWGFLISGKQTELARYEDARLLIHDNFATLQALITDNSGQMARYAALKQGISQRLAEMDRTIARHRTEDPQAAKQGGLEFDARSMDKIRELVGEMQREERQLLVGREDLRTGAVQWAFVTFAVAVAINLLLLIAIYVLVSRAMRVAAEDREQIARSNKELSSSLIEVGRQNRFISTLGELSRFLQACTTMDEIGRILGHFAPRVFDSPSGALYLFPASRNYVERVTSWGDEEFDVNFAPDACWALRRGQLYVPDMAAAEVACEHVHALAGSYACLPLTAQGELIGLLHLRAMNEDNGSFNARLAETAAEQIAVAIANLRLRDSLRQQSIRDGLTGLYNRRYLEEAMARELVRVVRLRENDKLVNLAVIMLDIDHFKRFNDNYGHEAGDLVLRELAKLMREQTRASDIVCRYGGEEFTIIMPDLDLEGAIHRAEALRRAVSHLSVKHQGISLGEINISLGIAMFPEHGETTSALFTAADEALYAAKNAGRNQVKVATGKPKAAHNPE